MSVKEKFLDYVSYDTQSDSSSTTMPSTMKQKLLAQHLADEMVAMGIEDAHMDEWGYVYGTIPANCEKKNVIGFIAHMDTAEEVSGANVKARVIENYDGEDIVLNKELGIVTDVENFPILKKFKGKTLIVTDGTTLLGADDKAGVAEIMQAAEDIIKNNLPHGEIHIAFTPDEEIGAGPDKFDVKGFSCDFAYTLDGGELGGLDYENFNGTSADVEITGRSVHPGSAKNAMKNAQNIAIEFHNALPYYDRPEYTENREGFYHLCSMEGDVTGAKLGYIVRDHSAESFAARKETMRHIAKLLNEKYGEGTVELELKDSYFSMLEKIKPHFHLVENARAAIRKAGLEPLETPIRGGTDGATLSYMGLPCPNLGTGGFNYHGPCEGITVEAMDKATEILLNLADIYKDVQ